jgi:1-acyl-sn-glycerol-3-phosphate acyltransferase
MKKKAISLVRLIRSYFLFSLVLVFLVIPLSVLLLVLPESYRETNALVYWFLDKIYCGMVFSLRVPVIMVGHLPVLTTPFIMVANHNSALDIPLLGMLVHGKPHVWYVLDEYGQHGILGFFIKKLFVIVKQDGGPEASRALHQGIRIAQKQDRYTLLFPEGTRLNSNHEPFCFFSGFAFIAKMLQQPVVPVYITGAEKVLPPGGRIPQFCPLMIQIGEPFYIQDGEELEGFKNRVQDWFEKRRIT